MSTYTDASLILPVAPERKAGKIYSLKPTDGTGDFTVSRASKKNEINSDLKLEIIANDVPAFNFDTIGGCPVLNSEPQATNLITYPISFDNAYWTKSSATIYDNGGSGYSAPSVDFPTSAFKLVESATTALHEVSKVLALAGVHSYSVYAKANERNWLIINAYSDGFNATWFDLDNGVVGTNAAGNTSTITAMADGWYKCTVSRDQSGATDIIGIGVSTGDGVISYLGDGSSGVYLFMAQVETGSVATSPTFTDITLAAEGSTTTRLADVVNKTSASAIIGQTEGAIFLNIKRGVQINNTQGLFGISSPSGDNRIIIWNIFTLNSLGIQIKANNANVITSQSLGVFNNGENYKIAVSYKSGEIKGYVNGLKIFNLTNTFTFTSALSEIYLNNYANNSFTEISPINELQIYNTALTGAKLATLTTL